jgi:purine-binding chemotaxis protein CheW
MDNSRLKELYDIVIFSLDASVGPRYALPLSSVERVVRIVEITPLPKAPDIILGIINMQGQVIPVINVRRRFHLPEREIELEDQLIIAKTSKRLVALVADSVSGVQRIEEKDIVNARQELPYAGYIEGVVKLENGLFLICDLNQFLSLDEEKSLDTALLESI